MRGAALALAVALGPVGAGAHPLDEVVQAAYLTLAPGEVRLELDVTPGPVVAGPVLAGLDPDGDGAATQSEARAFAREVLDRSTLLLDGAPAAWTLLDVEVPPLRFLAAGGAVLRIVAVAAREDAAGPHALSYLSSYEPAPSLRMANVFLLPGDGWGYAVTAQARSGDGARLDVLYEVRAR